MAGRSKCEDCFHYDYDEEIDACVCEMDLDEDEMARFLRAEADRCPYYQPGDDYTLARRQ
ncbi:hypothetical protein KQI82_11945 [Oscillibacter sp. MSJ-2]|uniref:DUF6472 domain-containing protein n=1 Tax=Dysosmobacter acutus TaxID=2841504 RepID=A0ABS6FDJ2_9FIRM|nr:DUF6472 family protein [Dysosmobacter acutus]MBU5627622.1 hypothetical protein [Dysosmobacter acutus]